MKEPFWSLSIKKTFELLKTEEGGLTTEEVEKRRALFGTNTIKKEKRISHLALFLRQFKNPLIVVLVVAATTTLFLGKFSDAIFISIAIFVNAGLGYYQENKAEQALEDLKKYVTQFVRVYRNQGEQQIKAEDLVPGDIIHISLGDKIPADARLIYANDLQIDEAILTGESLPVFKAVDAVTKTTSLGDRTSIVFTGSTVTEGFGRAVVTATDKDTELGKIAEMVFYNEEQHTPLQKSLTNFSLKMSGFLLILTIGVFFIAERSGMPLLDAFLISVAILVSAVPEGLPIVMTVILAIGVERLAKKNGVIRKLSAAETLGSTSIILTDKTGTLTQAKMSLEQSIVFENKEYTREDITPENHLLEMALLNLDAGIENPEDPVEEWRIVGKPIEAALIKGAGLRGVLLKETLKGKEQINLLPFNSKNKFSASIYETPLSFLKTTHSKNKTYIQSILGAPEIVLEKSKMPEKEKEEIRKQIATMAEQGDRLVAVAFKELKKLNDLKSWKSEAIENLHFMGIIALRDPLRENVRQVITEIQSAGVRVIIVTGDHAGTARAVARAIGLPSAEKNVLDGMALEAMTQKELLKYLPDISIVSRVSPIGKQKIVDALQSQGEVVAMNGDGINDAPAIKKADIGIAMGSGTDVTKGVADLVLLDDDFETIVEAVTEGRRIIQNIRKAIVYLSSAILDEMFLIGGALILGIPTPFNALQILWVNFFTDSFPGIALAFEGHIDNAGNKPTNIKKGIFTGEMKAIVLISGTISSILLIVTYVLLLPRFNEEIVKTFIFAAFATYSLFLGVSMRSLKKSIIQYNPFGNPYLVGSIGIGFIFTLAAIYLPLLQKLFHTVPLPFSWISGVILFGMLNILIIESVKHFFVNAN